MSKLAFKSELLFAENARLPAIKSWLLETVWTRSRYQESAPDQFLRGGEEVVYGLEELIATGAQGIWDELAAESRSAPALKTWLGLDAPLPLAQPAPPSCSTASRCASCRSCSSSRRIPAIA